MVGFKMKFSDIPTHLRDIIYALAVVAVVAGFIHNYAHAGGDAALIRHLEDFNGLVAKINTTEHRRLIQDATNNINFIDEKLAEDGITAKQERVFLRNREYYVDLRECYREERPVCE